MYELKPCPFCGGEATWSNKKMAVKCTKCLATIPAVKGLVNPASLVSSGYKNYMIGLWNRRA